MLYNITLVHYIASILDYLFNQVLQQQEKTVQLDNTSSIISTIYFNKTPSKNICLKWQHMFFTFIFSHYISYIFCLFFFL